LSYTYWSNASGTLPLNNPKAITVSGTYFIKATGPGTCSSISPVAVKINPSPAATISGAGSICVGTNKTLSVSLTGNAPWSLTYSDGTNSTVINAVTSSPYQLIVSPASNTTYTITSVSTAGLGCTNSANNSAATITVTPAEKGSRYTTVTTTPNTPTHLQARILGNSYKYEWLPAAGLNFPNVYNPVFNYNRETQYHIQITSPIGCITVDTLLVKMSSETNVFVPKAWSPNSDGHNEQLFPLTKNITRLTYFRVYNRWGQLMFQTDKQGEGWDGKLNGVAQISDVYTWTVEAVGADGVVYRQRGNSVLLR
jgi:gliding motility-associated-like protein